MLCPNHRFSGSCRLPHPDTRDGRSRLFRQDWLDDLSRNCSKHGELGHRHVTSRSDTAIFAPYLPCNCYARSLSRSVFRVRTGTRVAVLAVLMYSDDARHVPNEPLYYTRSGIKVNSSFGIGPKRNELTTATGFGALRPDVGQRHAPGKGSERAKLSQLAVGVAQAAGDPACVRASGDGGGRCVRPLAKIPRAETRHQSSRRERQ